jgi:hypothetical protein
LAAAVAAGQPIAYHKNKNKILRNVKDPDFHHYMEQEPDYETDKYLKVFQMWG